MTTPNQHPRSHNQDPQAGLQLDALVQDPNALHTLLRNPAEVMESLEQSDPNANRADIQRVVQNRSMEALEEIVVPETLAKMIGHSERFVAEESIGNIHGVRSRIEQATEGDEQRRFMGILRQIQEEVPSGRRAVRMIEEATRVRGRVNTEDFARGVRTLQNFYENYDGNSRRLRGAHDAKKDLVHGARVHAGIAAENTENGRNHFLTGKQKIEHDPNNAYYDGVEVDVHEGGAASVAEHKANKSVLVDEGLGRIADLRDDCKEVETALQQVQNGMRAELAMKDLPHANQFMDLTQQLRTAMHRVESGQPVHVDELLENVLRNLSRLEHGLHGVEDGSKQDNARLVNVHEKVTRILGSEIMQR